MSPDRSVTHVPGCTLATPPLACRACQGLGPRDSVHLVTLVGALATTHVSLRRRRAAVNYRRGMQGIDMKRNLNTLAAAAISTVKQFSMAAVMAAAFALPAVAQFTVQAKNVKFTTRLDIIPDEAPAGLSYSSQPHWTDGNNDGLPDTKTDPPTALPVDRNYPVHYTSQEACTVEFFQFELSGVPSGVTSGTLRVTPAVIFPDGTAWRFNSQLLPFMGTSASYQADTFVCLTRFPSGFVFNFPEFKIKWTVRLDQAGEPVGSGSVVTQHRVYVTRHAPKAADLFETLVDVVCRAADGLSDPEDIALAIDGAFTFGAMNSKAKDGWNRDDGLLLTYWNPNPGTGFTSQQFSLEALLSEVYTGGPIGDRRSGPCAAWADFYFEAYRVNDSAQDSITVQKVALLPIAPTQLDAVHGLPSSNSSEVGIVVNPVGYNAPSNIGNPEGFEYVVGVDAIVALPFSQGGLCPRNGWVDYCIVERNGVGSGTYYADPSFAAGLVGSLVDFEDAYISLIQCRYGSGVDLGKRDVPGGPRITSN